MKKIIFGSASAILAVVGFSAFKTAKTSATTYYWFQIINPGTGLGDNAILDNAEATFIQRSQTLSAVATPCDQVKGSQCAVGFSVGQIFTTTNGAKVLKTHGVDPAVSFPTQTSKTARTGGVYVRG